MIDPALLQAHRARLPQGKRVPGVLPPGHGPGRALMRPPMPPPGIMTQPPMPDPSSDAEFIDDDVYSGGAQAGVDSETETEPRGLVDRLYADQIPGRPMRGKPQMATPQSVPTTKNRFL